MNLLPPKAFGYELSRESFPRHTGKTFDAMALSEAAANHVLTILLHPERTARIFEFNARDDEQISLSDYIDHISRKLVTESKSKSGLERAIHQRVSHVLSHHIMMLAQNDMASSAVKGAAHMALRKLEIWYRYQYKKPSLHMSYKTHYQYEANRIMKFLSGKLKVTSQDVKSMPPGSPI